MKIGTARKLSPAPDVSNGKILAVVCPSSPWYTKIIPNALTFCRYASKLVGRQGVDTLLFGVRASLKLLGLTVVSTAKAEHGLLNIVLVSLTSSSTIPINCIPCCYRRCSPVRCRKQPLIHCVVLQRLGTHCFTGHTVVSTSLQTHVLIKPMEYQTRPTHFVLVVLYSTTLTRLC